MPSILYGLGAALAWGAGDFSGGLAARKLGAYRAVFWANLLGLSIVLPGALASGDPLPARTALVQTLLGGLLGSLGLLVLYYSLSVGQMSIAAPVSALFAALLPVVAGGFTQGLPTLKQFSGFGFALTAVWLIAQGNTPERFHIRQLTDLRLPILAGLGFGSYFTFLHYASADSASILWTMTFSRFAGTLLLLVMLLLRREPLLPIQRTAWLAVFFNATLDLGGNLFYLLAAQSGGRLDVSAVLSSLFPGSTVLLAWLVLKERIAPRQWLGIGMALIAIIFFTI